MSNILTDVMKSAKATQVYNALCNRCKHRIFQKMKADVQRDTPAMESESYRMGMSQYYAQQTEKLLCPICKLRYKEFLKTR